MSDGGPDAAVPGRSPGRPPSGRPRPVGFWLYAVHLWTVFAIALSNLLLGVSLLAAPWTARGRRPLVAGSSVLLAALGFYVLWSLVAVVSSYEPRVSLRATSELFNLTTLLLGLALVRGERQVRRIVDGLVVVAALVAAAGLSQFLVGYGDLGHRIRGPLSHYMTFSGVLLLADLLLLARLAWGGWRRPWRWAAAALINTALLASLTRSAWVGLAVAGVVLVWVRRRRLLWWLVPAAVAFSLLAPAAVRQRMASVVDLGQASNYDRLCMAEAGVRMIAERPLTGIGPEMVRRRYPAYRHPTAPRAWVPHLHNSFLQLAAERGLPALAAYLALVGSATAAAFRRWRAEGGRHGRRADLYAGTALALLAFNVAGLFENNWGDTEVQRLVLFLLALPFVLPQEAPSPALEASANEGTMRCHGKAPDPGEGGGGARPVARGDGRLPAVGAALPAALGGDRRRSRAVDAGR